LFFCLEVQVTNKGSRQQPFHNKKLQWCYKSSFAKLFLIRIKVLLAVITETIKHVLK